MNNNDPEIELPNEIDLPINNDNKIISLFNILITINTLFTIDLSLILNKYNQLLSISDLLIVINYDYNKIFIDKFWQNIEEDRWIYLDNELINWFEYKDLNKSS